MNPLPRGFRAGFRREIPVGRAEGLGDDGLDGPGLLLDSTATLVDALVPASMRWPPAP